jgi:predicted permease
MIPVVHSLEDAIVGSVQTAILAMSAAVAVVLLIASANAAILLLMRSEARRAELAIREALGAGRGRIVGQVLAEALLLSITATALAGAIGWSSLRAILAFVPDGLPRIDAVRVDGAVLALTVVAGAFTWIAAAVGPAVAAARSDLPSRLQSGGRGTAGSRTRQWRRTLVVAQVALAVAIVAAAGLLIRTVLRLQRVDVGVAADRLVLIETSLPDTKYAGRKHSQFLDDAIAQLEAVPGVIAATAVNVAPFAGDAGWDVPRFMAEAQTAEQAAANPPLNLESVDPGYFRTFDIPMRLGRAFSRADREGATAAAIVSEDVAAWIWPGQDPTGRRLKMGSATSDGPWLTIVGVAASTRYRDLARPRPTIYLPAAQFLMTAGTLVVRTTAAADLVAAVARERLRAIDPNVQVLRVTSFNQLRQAPLARPRFNATVLGVFGITSLLLTTIGLYAVIAAHVRQRDREIAVRVALGATAAHLRRLVMGEAIWLAGTGAGAGLGAAAAANRSLHSLLYEVDPLDPGTLLGAATLLVGLALLASYVPMRRAVRRDAAEALRA